MPMSYHMTPGCLTAEKQPLEIRTYDLIPFLLLQVECRLGKYYARAVNQDVETTHLVNGQFETTADFSDAPDIHDYFQRPTILPLLAPPQWLRRFPSQHP